jgi:hypothetical protein
LYSFLIILPFTALYQRQLNLVPPGFVTPQTRKYMMIGTIMLAFLVLGFILYIVYVFWKGEAISRKKAFLISGIFIITIFSLFFFTGIRKINADLARIIHNSGPKSPSEIYSILFKKPMDSSIVIVNIKDQVIPKLDCCIWMEARVFPSEIKRIASLKKFETFAYSRSDSLTFLKPFANRPAWWSPQNLGDSVVALHFKFNQDNQQSIFFGKDSTRIFICDQAL